MRDKIFISHATPDDNDFTKWLALKLISLGYEVWCDILELDKGIDFWKTIEKEIRESAIKFLVVLSENKIFKLPFSLFVEEKSYPLVFLIEISPFNEQEYLALFSPDLKRVLS